MPVPGILKFENKKAILPIALVCLLVLVIVLDVIYAEPVKKDIDEVADNAMEAIRLAVYSAGLNHTDSQLEREANLSSNRAAELQKNFYKIIVPLSLTYGSEYTMNTFGTGFCMPDIFVSISDRKECTGTKLDFAYLSKIMKMVVCATDFVVSANNATKYPGNILLSDDLARKREFIYSENGKNIYNNLEHCRYAAREDAITSREFWINASGNAVVDPGNLFESLGQIPQMRFIGPADIAIYAVILVVVGYLVSCLVIWLHRKNPVLQGRGKKVYASILLFTMLFLAIIYFSSPYYSWLLFNFRLVVIMCIIFAYAATTIVFGLCKRKKGPKKSNEEESIMKELGVYKKTKKK